MNMGLLLFGLTMLMVQQDNGNYRCRSFSVQFGDDTWDNAWIELENGELAKRLLVYSHFNGVYVGKGVAILIHRGNEANCFINHFLTSATQKMESMTVSDNRKYQTPNIELLIYLILCKNNFRQTKICRTKQGRRRTVYFNNSGRNNLLPRCRVMGIQAWKNQNRHRYWRGSEGELRAGIILLHSKMTILIKSIRMSVIGYFHHLKR